MTEATEWRVFCGIDLPDDVRERVKAHGRLLHHAVPNAHASWIRPGNIHLTLKFLGDVPQTAVPNVSEAVSRAASGLMPFRIRIEQPGVFPSRGVPRVLWIGVNDLERKLAELQLSVEDESEKAGFLREVRPFHPHLTLARLRQPQHSRALAAAHTAMEFEPAEFTVAEVLVIRSELSSGGSRYTTISRHPFAEPSG